MHGHVDQHALPEIADRRHEQRARGQRRPFDDLGHVLVLEAEAVFLEQRRLVGLVGLDHLPPAAGIAGDRVDRQREVGRDQTCVDQRAKNRNGAGGVAAGIGDLAGALDGVALPRCELRKSVCPAVGHAMRGGGVEQPRPVGAEALDNIGRFAGRVVGQAENGEIDRGQQFGLGAGILAPLGVDRDELDARVRPELLPDLEPGGAGLAVDEDSCGHDTP